MARAAVLGRLTWQFGTLAEIVRETPRVSSLFFDVPEWPGHLAGQHVDVRLTADDGYRAERSYSIASAPQDKRLALTVERLDDGEVSPYLVGELRVGDRLELRGPIGGYFVWRGDEDRPLLLIGGGSGIVPLMSMLRHRGRIGSKTPARLLFSSRTLADVIYREELQRPGADQGLEVHLTLTREWPHDWPGHLGRIDSQLLDQVAWSPAEAPTH